MAEKTTLDLYRREYEAPRRDHYTHFYPGGSKSWSTEDFFSATAALAEGLDRLGIHRGDRVMLLSDNRPEWHQVDLAVADLGAVSVPVYGTLTPPQIAYQANDSGAVAAVVETPQQLEKFLAIRRETPELKHLILMEGTGPREASAWKDIVASGKGPAAADHFWERATSVQAEDLLTLIYTSGTTGDPKGVMLTHSNLVQNVLFSAERARFMKEDLALEFLPLCHVFERMVGYIYMWAACSKAYCSVYHVGDLVAGIAPTVFASVPRFYEKVHDTIQEKVGAASSTRQALFHWAVRTGMKAMRNRPSGQAATEPRGLAHGLADKLVLSKLRQALGGRLRFCISGGAPLPQFLGEFYHAVGIYVAEGYGLTETSPVIAVNGMGPGELRLGTVGRPLDNLQVRIAADGEICVKGPSVMTGYWNKDEKTAEVFDDEGYFLTGDIGEIDPDGFLKITDRKKDLIVTAGGKNVAPQPIENEFKRSPFVDNAVLIGDKRPYIVALISPNTEELERWANTQGIEFSSIEDLTHHPKVEELFESALERVNDGLARYEQVKKFRVLPLMLSVEEGHLTPTLKVKRRVVERQYVDLIEEMYNES